MMINQINLLTIRSNFVWILVLCLRLSTNDLCCHMALCDICCSLIHFAYLFLSQFCAEMLNSTDRLGSIYHMLRRPTFRHRDSGPFSLNQVIVLFRQDVEVDRFFLVHI